MRVRPYGEDKPERPGIGEFIEILICGFMTFTGCIGGWLVHFGMDAGWMFGLSGGTAILFALAIIKR